MPGIPELSVSVKTSTQDHWSKPLVSRTLRAFKGYAKMNKYLPHSEFWNRTNSCWDRDLFVTSQRSSFLYSFIYIVCVRVTNISVFVSMSSRYLFSRRLFHSFYCLWDIFTCNVINKFNWLKRLSKEHDIIDWFKTNTSYVCVRLVCRVETSNTV